MPKVSVNDPIYGDSEDQKNLLDNIERSLARVVADQLDGSSSLVFRLSHLFSKDPSAGVKITFTHEHAIMFEMDSHSASQSIYSIHQSKNKQGIYKMVQDIASAKTFGLTFFSEWEQYPEWVTFFTYLLDEHGDAFPRKVRAKLRERCNRSARRVNFYVDNSQPASFGSFIQRADRRKTSSVSSSFLRASGDHAR